MNTTLKAILWVIVLGVVAWAGYTLLGVEPAPVAEEQVAVPVPPAPIVVGVIAPLSGDGAVYGEPMRNVIAIAADEINAAGGINGAMLEFVYEDDKCTGQDGASAIQKLIAANGVKAVIGSMCSSATLSAIPIAEASQVVILSPGASSPDLTGKSRFFARNYPSDLSQGTVLGEAAGTIKKWKKVAVLQEQTDYAAGIFKAFDAAFVATGGKTVKEEFAPETKDFRSIVTKLKAGKPEALFIDVQTAPAAERILKQVKELKWKVAIIVNDVVPGNQETLKNYSDILEGALAAEFTPSNNDRFLMLKAAYQTRYGVDMPYQSYGQTEYDAVYILKDALLAVGNDGAKIADWLRTVNGWQGASGSVTIGADGDRVGGHTLEVIRNGKAEIYGAPQAASVATSTASTTTQ